MTLSMSTIRTGMETDERKTSFVTCKNCGKPLAQYCTQSFRVLKIGTSGPVFEGVMYGAVFYCGCGGSAAFDGFKMRKKSRRDERKENGW